MIDAEKGDHRKLSEDDILICHNIVYGFSLATKKWGTLFLSSIRDIDFDHTAFESLVIPQHQKDLIRTLVKEHQNPESTFDDIIKGKGKGLVFLLHGDPGVGKTLTAGKVSSAVGSQAC